MRPCAGARAEQKFISLYPWLTDFWEAQTACSPAVLDAGPPPFLSVPSVSLTWPSSLSKCFPSFIRPFDSSLPRLYHVQALRWVLGIEQAAMPALIPVGGAHTSLGKTSVRQRIVHQGRDQASVAWKGWCLCFFFFFSQRTVGKSRIISIKWDCHSRTGHGYKALDFFFFKSVKGKPCFPHMGLSWWLAPAEWALVSLISFPFLFA